MKRDEIARVAKKNLRSDEAKTQVKALVKNGFSSDEVECIRADDPEFAKYGGISFSDLGVLLRFQEDLLFSCERWKQ